MNLLITKNISHLLHTALLTSAIISGLAEVGPVLGQAPAPQPQARHSAPHRLPTRAPMDRKLTISPQQKSRMQSIVHQTTVQMQVINNNRALSPRQKQEQLQHLRLLTHARVLQVLTVAQRKQLAALQADSKALPAR